MPSPLVSVIIPAFNASNTLDATLQSVREQTHRELEILVVDDGSTDETAGIVERHAGADGRVRLLRQLNGGVARARNHGLAIAAGDFAAPLDADDIWHPAKIERQLAVMQTAGDDCALVYNWFRRIDLAGRIVGTSASPEITGRVLMRHIDWNFISNGSTPLVRMPLARDVGYDISLHDAGLQGCEDYLFQLRLALRHRFACAPAFLTGYRIVPGAMSARAHRMIRSHIMAYSLLAAELDDSQAEARALIDRRIATLRIELARNRLRRGDLRQGLGNVVRAFLLDTGGAWQGLRAELRRLRAGSFSHADMAPGPSFAQMEPEAPDGMWSTRRSDRWLARLAALDGD